MRTLDEFHWDEEEPLVGRRPSSVVPLKTKPRGKPLERKLNLELAAARFQQGVDIWTGRELDGDGNVA